MSRFRLRGLAVARPFRASRTHAHPLAARSVVSWSALALAAFATACRDAARTPTGLGTPVPARETSGTAPVAGAMSTHAPDGVLPTDGATGPTIVARPTSVDPAFGDPSAALRAPVDGGQPDALMKGAHLVWQNIATGERSMWIMNGAQYANQAVILPTVPTDWQIAAAADFSGDGQPDLLWQNTVTGQRSIWIMNGPAYTNSAVLLPTVPTQWRIAGAADFNADGNADIVWQNTQTGERSLWLMSRTSYTGNFALLPTVPVQWSIAAVEDFNADNKPDLVWQNTTTGERSIWFMNGPAYSNTAAILPTVPTQWSIAGAADFTSDGKADLVWQNTQTGERSIWFMNGATYTNSFALLPTVPPSWRIATVGDFSGSISQPPLPVRLTIQKIEVFDPTLGTLVQADLNNISGVLFVTVHLDPGDNRLDALVLTLGGESVNCQTFSAQLTQASRAAPSFGAADVIPITCVFNTSQFNTTTGQPLLLNGGQQLSATVFYHPGKTGSTPGTQQTARLVNTLTVNNQSGVYVTVANTPSASQAAVAATGQAVGPQGVTWRAGTVNVTVLPVNFDPLAQPSTSPTMVALVDCPTLTGCSRVVATAPATKPQGSNAGTATFTGDTGCYWDANYGSAATGYQALFTSSGTQTGGTGVSGAFCAGFGGANVSGFTGDPATNTLVGYTTPNAARTISGTNVPADLMAATFVVVGGTTPSFGIGSTSTVVLAANGLPISAFNRPGNAPPGIGGNVAAALYVDNQAPEPLAQANFPTTNFSTSFDAGFSANLVFGYFTANQSLTSAVFQFAYFDPITGALTTANPDWGGVDRVSEAFFAQSLAGGASNQTTSNPTTFVGTATRVTSTAQLAPLPPSGSTNSYRLAFQGTDALGNRRNQFVNQVFNPGQATAALVQTRFNLDVAAPTLQLLTDVGPQGQTRVGPSNTVFGPNAIRTGFATTSNVALAPQIAFQASDDIGFGPTPISATIARYRRVGTTATVECLSSVDQNGTPTFVNVTSGAAGSNGSSCVPVLAPLQPINVPTNVSALYSGSVQGRDQAGNLSAPVTFNFVVDLAPPTNISLSIPQVLAGGQPVTFTAGASDNLAVRSGAPRIGYPTLPSPLVYNESTPTLSLATIFAGLNPQGTGALPPQNETSMSLTIPSFIRTVTNIDAGYQPAAYGTASTFQAQIFDLANNSGLSVALPIPASSIPNVPASSPYTNAANPANNVITFSLAVKAGATPVPNGTASPTATICGPLSVSGGCPGTATFSAVQQGAENAYVSPFNRIELWVFDPVAQGYRFLATLPGGFATNIPGQPRQVTSVLSLPANTQPYFLAPSAAGSPTSYQIVAIGINGTGDALVSNPVTVTINP